MSVQKTGYQKFTAGNPSSDTKGIKPIGIVDLDLPLSLLIFTFAMLDYNSEKNLHFIHFSFIFNFSF